MSFPDERNDTSGAIPEGDYQKAEQQLPPVTASTKTPEPTVAVVIRKIRVQRIKKDFARTINVRINTDEERQRAGFARMNSKRRTVEN